VSMSGEPTRRTRVTATIVVFALLAVGLFFGVRALIDVAGSRVESSPTSSPTPTSTGIGFTYTSADYGYSVEFPAEPTEQARTVQVGDAEVPVTSAAWDNGTASLVSTGARYPAGALSDTTVSLKSALDGLVANTSGATLVSSDPVKLGEFPAVKATISVPAGNIVVIIAIDGDTQYQLVAANTDQTVSDGFFNSFHPG
jgi:hypothetical protein